jgi:DNA-binding CsgD family transcriptional regulator
MMEIVADLVGRDEEVAAVRQALTRAGGAPQGLVWITGEAGIGKSALAAGIAESIDPFEVFHGVADQVGLRPFGAIVDAFGAAVLPQMQAALGAIVQVPAAVQVSDAVLAILGDRASQAANSGRPVVVVLDDLHRADDQTLDAIELVAGALRDESIVMLATARPTTTGSRLSAAVHSASAATHLQLGHLDQAAIATLVRGASSSDTTDQSVSAAVAAADGNPMLALAVAASAATGTPGAPQQSGAPAVAGLATFVRRALAELGDVDAEVAQAIAVIGAPVVFDEVAAVSAIDPEAAARAIDRAVVAGLALVDGTLVRPRHDLVADEVVGTLSPARRSVLHRRAAEHLRAVGGPAHRLVGHALDSGASDLEWVVEVIEGVALTEPASALMMVDAVKSRVANAGLMRRLDVVRARGLSATGRTTEAASVASALLDVTTDPEVQAVLLFYLAVASIVEGKPVEGTQRMTAALEMMGDPVARARGRSGVAVASLVSRDFPGAARHAVEALREAETIKDPVALASALAVSVFVAACSADVDGLRAQRRRLSSMLTMSGVEPAYVFQPWLIAALTDLDLGDTVVAATTAADGRANADRAGTIWAISGYDAVSATAAWADGGFSDAIAIARGAIDGAQVSDPFSIGPWAWGVMALAAHELGDHDLALSAVQQGEALMATAGPALGAERWALAASRAYTRLGRLDDARQLLDVWWTLYEFVPSRLAQAALAGDLASLAVMMGDQARAEAVATTMQRFAGSPIPLLAALSAEATCWAQPDATTLLAAADAWSVAPKGLALAGLGRLSRLEVDERSSRLVQQRHALLRGQLGLDGAALVATEPTPASALAAASTGRTSVSGLGALTRSEHEVARLVAEGWSNREIADRLVVSRRTVESHMSAIYRKLAVTTRVQVANTVLGVVG